MDYHSFSSIEYVKESEKPTSFGGSDWLQCASKHTGIPPWLLAFAIFAAVLSAVWLCLSPEKVAEQNNKGSAVDPNNPCKKDKLLVYLPFDGSVYKKESSDSPDLKESSDKALLFDQKKNDSQLSYSPYTGPEYAPPEYDDVVEQNNLNIKV